MMAGCLGLFVMVEMAVLEGHHPVLYIHGLLAHPLCLCEGGDATPAFLAPSHTAQFVSHSPVRSYQSSLCCASQTKSDHVACEPTSEPT